MVKSGIYKIKNIITNDFYIGCSVNLERREKKHFYELKRNTHHSSFLQRAYNKYGKENFIFELIEECSKEELKEKELNYINDLKPSYNYFHAYPYNVEAIICTEERKIRMREKQKDIWKNKSYEDKQIVIDRLNTFRFDSTGKKRSLEHRNIIKSNQLKPEFRNKLWEYKEKLMLENKDTYRKRAVDQYDLENNFIKDWDSIKTASEELDIKRCGISNCCAGRDKTYRGFIWKYKNIK